MMDINGAPQFMWLLFLLWACRNLIFFRLGMANHVASYNKKLSVKVMCVASGQNYVRLVRDSSSLLLFAAVTGDIPDDRALTTWVPE